MLKVSVALLALSLGFMACGSSGDKTRAADPTTTADSVLPKDADIQSLVLSSGNASTTGQATYTFSPSDLILKGSWEKHLNSELVEAHGETAINELEWLLVQQNVQNLKLEAVDKTTCGKTSGGSPSILTVTYNQAGESKTLKLPTQSSLPYVCGDYAMPDANFKAILDAVEGKLPVPTDDSAYSPVTN